MDNLVYLAMRITRSKPLIFLLLLPGLSISAGNVFAAELELEMAVGLDHNPYRFSTNLSRDSGQYMAPSIKGEAKVFGDFGVLGKYSGTFYNKAVDDADNERLRLGLFYDSKFKVSGKKSNLRSEIFYGFRDKTYVSRNTGQIATYSGSPIGDRYDYDFFGINNEFKVRLSRKNRIAASLDLVVKDYQNYRQRGLDNLDHSAGRAGVSWLHKFNRKHSLRSQFSFDLQKYDDRREADDAGRDVSGTDLNYSRYLSRLVYSYKPHKSLRMSFTGLFDTRSDSGGGYYDANRLSLRYGLSYKLDRYAKVKTSVTFNSFDYPNRKDNPDPQDDELSEEDSVKFKLAYYRGFKKDKGLQAFAAFRFDYVSSDVAIYEYDRYRLEFGVSYQFESK